MSECICEGNWRKIVKENEANIGKVYLQDGDPSKRFTFVGVLWGDDDFYYAMFREGRPHLLSCVSNIEQHGYSLAHVLREKGGDASCPKSAPVTRVNTAGPTPTSNAGGPTPPAPQPATRQEERWMPCGKRLGLSVNRCILTEGHPGAHSSTLTPAAKEAHHNCPHQYYNDCAEHGPFTPAPQPPAKQEELCAYVYNVDDCAVERSKHDALNVRHPFTPAAKRSGGRSR